MMERGAEVGGVAERRRRLAGASAAAVLVVVAVLLAIFGGSGDSAPESVESPPHFVDASELTDLEASLGHPIYWAGPQAGKKLELHVEANGSAYLRYLTLGAEAGDPRQVFPTVGTYPVPDAPAALGRTAAASGAQLERLANGAVALPNPASMGSVYLAYPGSDLEIEVYDPAPTRALMLIRSGAILPVGE